MELFLVLTLAWAGVHIIAAFARFGIAKDKTSIKQFLLIDLLGTYVILWVCAGLAYIINLFID